MDTKAKKKEDVMHFKSFASILPSYVQPHITGNVLYVNVILFFGTKKFTSVLRDRLSAFFALLYPKCSLLSALSNAFLRCLH